MSDVKNYEMSLVMGQKTNTMKVDDKRMVIIDCAQYQNRINRDQPTCQDRTD